MELLLVMEEMQGWWRRFSPWLSLRIVAVKRFGGQG